MLTLCIVAFISGLVTIAAPCIWPLLPIILSASVTGDKRSDKHKPLGITLGIITSFTVLTLALSYVVTIIPFDSNALRWFAAVMIILLGISLLIPSVSARLEGWVSRFSGKFSLPGNGFLTGLSLGVIWAPCAGPIFATIATLAATRAVTGEVVVVTLAYVSGIAIPLFLFASLGRRIFTKTKWLNRYLGRIQQGFGVVMIITALAIITNYDKVVEIKLLNLFPSYTTFLNRLENQPSVQAELQNLKGSTTTATINNNTGLYNVTPYPAPDFVANNNWLNSPALQLSGLKGKVVLVDFWTYTCINCIRTLPHVTGWYEKYKDQGLVVVGVHTPEFDFEKKTTNVQQAIKQFNITYPVVQDNDYAIWNSYYNRYWPAEYLIDATGQVRRVEFGEGEYDKMEQAIQGLLAEAGKTVSTNISNIPDTTPTTQLTPETYLGSTRSSQAAQLTGDWQDQGEYIESGANAQLKLPFQAQQVFLVLTPPTDQAVVTVYLDDKLVTADQAGTDVVNGQIIFSGAKLYHLLKLSDHNQPHTIKLDFATPGVQAFAFTFGD